LSIFSILLLLSGLANKYTVCHTTGLIENNLRLKLAKYLAVNLFYMGSVIVIKWFYFTELL